MRTGNIKRPPALTIKEAGDIIFKIYEKSAGGDCPENILPPIVKSKPSSSLFERKISSLSLYGLIDRSGKGSDRAVKINEFGKSVIIPVKPDEKQNALKKALLKIDLTHEFWNKYSATGLPDNQVLKNLLERNNTIGTKSVNEWATYLRNAFNSLNDLDKKNGLDDHHEPDNSELSHPSATITPHIAPNGGGKDLVFHIPMSTGGTASVIIPSGATDKDIKKIIYMVKGAGDIEESD